MVGEIEVDRGDGDKAFTQRPDIGVFAAIQQRCTAADPIMDPAPGIPYLLDRLFPYSASLPGYSHALQFTISRQVDIHKGIGGQSLVDDSKRQFPDQVVCSGVVKGRLTGH